MSEVFVQRNGTKLHLNAKQRSDRARKAAHAQHAKHDPYEITKAARAAFLKSLGTKAERSAYFVEMARKSAAVRRAKTKA